MRTIGIAGSPRKNSNTEFYVKVALETLEKSGIDTELILLSDKTIYPCDGDYRCWQTNRGECELRGDDFHVIYKKMIDADAIIVGSPTHIAAPHPKLWSLLVRAEFPHATGIYAYMTGPGQRKASPFSGKVGGPIVVARRTGATNAFSQLLLWFYISGFIIPGNIYWNVGMARVVGDAQKDEEGIRVIKCFAQNIAWTLEKICK